MQKVSSRLEMPSDRAKGREKALGLCGLMRKRRIFFSRRRVGWCECSARLFHTRVLAVLPALQDLAFRRSIPFQLIGNNHARNVLQPFEKFAKKSLGGFFVASAL